MTHSRFLFTYMTILKRNKNFDYILHCLNLWKVCMAICMMQKSAHHQAPHLGLSLEMNEFSSIDMAMIKVPPD